MIVVEMQGLYSSVPRLLAFWLVAYVANSLLAFKHLSKLLRRYAIFQAPTFVSICFTDLFKIGSPIVTLILAVSFAMRLIIITDVVWILSQPLTVRSFSSFSSWHTNPRNLYQQPRPSRFRPQPFLNQLC